METNQQLELFKHGPLYEKRFEIVNQLKSIGLKSGDILYRASDAKGPLGLPFSRIVARVTNSKYSHAAIVFIENEEIQVLEVNDQGTLKYRLLDWIDTCYNQNLGIYRLKNITSEQEIALAQEIHKILEADPDYDFTFSDPDKYYCTESVVKIYENALGIKLDEGYYIKDLVPTLLYCVLRVGSFLFSCFGTSLPFNEKLYFVGNEKRGMLSSPLTEVVFELTDSDESVPSSR